MVNPTNGQSYQWFILDNHEKFASDVTCILEIGIAFGRKASRIVVTVRPTYPRVQENSNTQMDG